MELLRDSIPMVSLAVSAAALYARAACSRLRPGLPRLAALLPVVVFFSAVPMAFSSSILRSIAGFFLGWLSTFKVALLAAGRGPLDPALPVGPFLFTAAFPVKLRRRGGRPGDAGASKTKIVSWAVEVAILAVVLHLYQFKNRLNLYVRYFMYGVHIYCLLSILLPCTAAAGRALGMEMERQFDSPILAMSLRNFWGRRWNLMVSSILRSSVYDPVCARAGKGAGALATFLVSGVMHEVMVYYLLLRSPTGEMVAFFLLHGACCLAEDWCTQQWAARGWPPPPRQVTWPLLVLFMAGTLFWLFFPPICREGGEEMLLEEWAAVLAYFLGVGQNLLRIQSCFKIEMQQMWTPGSGPWNQLCSEHVSKMLPCDELSSQTKENDNSSSLP